MEWLRAIGEWLWFNLVARLRLTTEKVRFRRILFLAALFVAVIAFAQIVSIDLAFIWAMDTAFYVEIASAVMAFAVVGYARRAIGSAAHRISIIVHRSSVATRRLASRQRRNLAALRRGLAKRSADRSEDDAAIWSAGSPVAA